MNPAIEMSLIEFFKRCRKPIYYKTKLNALRLNEVLSLGGMRVSDNKGRFYYGQAYIKKEERGRYSLTGIWTLVTKETRKDIWMQGSFALTKGKVSFENGMTNDHLRAFFKVCRYLNVYKCVERNRSQNAHKQWRKSIGGYDRHHHYPLATKEHHGSWFFAKNIEPLFCGEVLNGLCLERGKGAPKKIIDLDIRDRICTSAIVAMVYKSEEEG